MKKDITKIMLIVCAAVALSGCSKNMDDLHQFVQQVKSRHFPKPKPIPKLEPYQNYTYHDQGMRPPFQRPVAARKSNGVRPDQHRNKEYLEQFPLDSLTMVGTIRVGGVQYALIKDSDGLVHKVHRGNYIGQNDGRITSIESSGLTLREIVPNGLGGYVKRKTKVPLTTAG